MARFITFAVLGLSAFIIYQNFGEKSLVGQRESSSTTSNYQLASQDFSKDPLWKGVNNKTPIAPIDCKPIAQNYGWNSTNHLGRSGGDIGGYFDRTIRKGYIGDHIGSLDFNRELRASGYFKASNGTDGSIHIGWFNDKIQGWRPWNFIGWRLDDDKGNTSVKLDYMTGEWNAGGYDSPLVISDGKTHFFEFHYDPLGANGLGVLSIIIDRDQNKKFSLTMDPGHKQIGGQMNRFGFFHAQRSAGAKLIGYFDDLTYTTQEGIKSENFQNNPVWDEFGNRDSFTDCEPFGYFNFGYSPTQYAGGDKGEIGGLFWRISGTKKIYYADTVGPFGLEDYLEASGKISMTLGSSDGAVYFGFFNEATIEQFPPLSFLGIRIEGPSSEGHYFAADYKTPKNECPYETCVRGARIFPDSKSVSWKLKYNPNANSGDGEIEVIFGNKVHHYKMQPGHKMDGAQFTHFGIFPSRADGGSAMRVFWDDLVYTKLKNN